MSTATRAGTDRAMDPSRRSPESGQSLLETAMVLGLVVAIAIVINSLLHPIVVDAFRKMSENLSAVGP